MQTEQQEQRAGGNHVVYAFENAGRRQVRNKAERLTATREQQVEPYDWATDQQLDLDNPGVWVGI